MTEEQLLLAVVDAYRTAGRSRVLRWQHIRRSDQALIMGDVGMPDLVVVRRRDGVPLPFVEWIELKTMRGHTTTEQERWADALVLAGQRYVLLRPDGLDAYLADVYGDRLLSMRGAGLL